MTTGLLIIIVLVITGVLVHIEHLFKPRIDITKEGQVLLWYTNKESLRDYKHLFNIK